MKDFLSQRYFPVKIFQRSSRTKTTTSLSIHHPNHYRSNKEEKKNDHQCSSKPRSYIFEQNRLRMGTGFIRHISEVAVISPHTHSRETIAMMRSTQKHHYVVRNNNSNTCLLPFVNSMANGTASVRKVSIKNKSTSDDVVRMMKTEHYNPMKDRNTLLSTPNSTLESQFQFHYDKVLEYQHLLQEIETATIAYIKDEDNVKNKSKAHPLHRVLGDKLYQLLLPVMKQKYMPLPIFELYAEFILERVLPLCFRIYDEEQLRKKQQQQQKGTTSLPSPVVMNWKTSPLSVGELRYLFLQLLTIRCNWYKIDNGRVVQNRRQQLQRQSQSESRNEMTTNGNNNSNKSHNEQSINDEMMFPNTGYLKLYSSVHIWNYICRWGEPLWDRLCFQRFLSSILQDVPNSQRDIVLNNDYDSDSDFTNTLVNPNHVIEYMIRGSRTADERSSQIQPDVDIFNAALSVWKAYIVTFGPRSDGLYLKKAIEIWKTMIKQTNVIPDERTVYEYMYILQLHGKNDQVELLFQRFYPLCSQNPKICKVLIIAYTEQNKLDTGGYLRQMVENILNNYQVYLENEIESLQKNEKENDGQATRKNNNKNQSNNNIISDESQQPTSVTTISISNPIRSKGPVFSNFTESGFGRDKDAGTSTITNDKLATFQYKKEQQVVAPKEQIMVPSVPSRPKEAFYNQAFNYYWKMKYINKAIQVKENRTKIYRLEKQLEELQRNMKR